MQYVRRAPREQRTIVTRTVVASPLVRAVYASRTRAIPMVYHPRYIAGRVLRDRRGTVIIDPPAGAPIVVRDVIVGAAAPAIPVGTYVTMPVTYANGYYTYAQPAYYPNYAYNSGYAPSYNYGYAPQYAYAPPMYCNGGDSSSLLYAALLPAVVSALTGNGSSFNTSDLTQAALGAALGGGNTCGAYVPAGYSPYYTQPVYSSPNYTYVTPATYSVPITYAVTQAVPAYYDTTGYSTPYDNCLYSGDEDGDENGCVSSGYMQNGYTAYSPYGAYTPQQVQGVVVGRSGDLLMVMGTNGTPTFVYAAPALQSGFTNGPIQPGAIVDAYGYYSGNTFIATALV